MYVLLNQAYIFPKSIYTCYCNICPKIIQGKLQKLEQYRKEPTTISNSISQKEKKELIIDIDTFELEEQLRRMLIYTRKQCSLTQQQLSEKSGIRQSNISRIESGSCIPTIQTLKELATAMGKKVKIELV